MSDINLKNDILLNQLDKLSNKGKRILLDYASEEPEQFKVFSKIATELEKSTKQGDQKNTDYWLKQLEDALENIK